MSRIKHFALGASLGLAMAALATPALAQTFEPLSKHHINYGVSSLNYGDVGLDSDITLLNPGPVDMLVGVLAYAREVDRYAYHGFAGQLIFKERVTDPEAETFLACTVVHLTPHAAKKIFVPSEGFPPRYVETISVSRQKQDVSDGTRARVADGLGTRLTTSTDFVSAEFEPQSINIPKNLAHPSLFTLPDDRPWWLDPENDSWNQQEVAVDCLCAGLTAVKKTGIKPVSVFAFNEFGIDCSGGELQ